MLLSIDFESELPIYIQLKSQIIEGIAGGELQPGQALPSVRQLAADLGINLHTVNKTYNLLKQDGFLLVHRQKGVVINQREAMKITEEYLGRLQAELRPLITEAFSRGMENDDFNKTTELIFKELKAKRGK
jgi:DNA-binding transcriptional regulator YhcF (GntR family)